MSDQIKSPKTTIIDIPLSSGNSLTISEFPEDLYDTDVKRNLVANIYNLGSIEDLDKIIELKNSIASSEVDDNIKSRLEELLDNHIVEFVNYGINTARENSKFDIRKAIFEIQYVADQVRLVIRNTIEAISMLSDLYPKKAELMAEIRRLNELYNPIEA